MGINGDCDNIAKELNGISLKKNTNIQDKVEHLLDILDYAYSKTEELGTDAKNLKMNLNNLTESINNVKEEITKKFQAMGIKMELKPSKPISRNIDDKKKLKKKITDRLMVNATMNNQRRDRINTVEKNKKEVEQRGLAHKQDKAQHKVEATQKPTVDIQKEAQKLFGEFKQSEQKLEQKPAILVPKKG